MATQNKIEKKAPIMEDGGGMSMHQLSHYFGYKCSVGHIVPVVSDLLNPNERIRLKVNTALKVQPLVNPAFVDIDVRIDYFFVPLSMLAMDFETKFSNTKEFFSSYVDTRNGNRNLPLWNGLVGSGTVFDDLKYFRTFGGINEPLMSDSVNRLLSYNNRPAFESLGMRILRLMDYFGMDLPKLYEGSLMLSELNITDYSADGQTVSSVMYPNFSPIYYQDQAPQQRSVPTSFMPHFPWKLLAYNCIWENYFRLDDFTPFDPSYFNIDRTSSSATASDLSSILTSTNKNEYDKAGIKYCPKNIDYFTSCVNSPVVQGVNILSDSLPANEQWITGAGGVFPTYPNSTSGNIGSLTDGTVGSMSLSTMSSSTNLQSVSLARLRLVKAQEKMLQIYGRLPKKNYDNFVYALFGKKVPHDVKHEMSHLGGEHFKININQITSLASTDQAVLGEYAGNGMGSSNSHGIKFTAPCHGVVMAVQYVRPRFMYAGGFVRDNYITSYDSFFLPPYDNLGRQPVFAFERPLMSQGTRSNIIGWQYRWQEWKTKIDRVTRAFQFGTERSWFLVNDNALDIQSSQSQQYTFDLGFRYVDPCALNDLMAVQYDPFFKFDYRKVGQPDNIYENYFMYPYLMYTRDPFICVSRIDYTKFSKMSVYSLQTVD